ncbi:MAG: type II toxin-antitoxin system RelE/ParE family toxin [Myxococcales bacterium]|nr:type II toxin-antitoxin system RelE/ParE family toxin [Myxococcales bacterium]
MKRVVWTSGALADYEAILDFVTERDGIEHAERLHRKLHPAVGRLATHPERCRVVPELRAVGVVTYRELIVKPYRVPFRVRGDDVLVLAVLDARRDLEETLFARLTQR